MDVKVLRERHDELNDDNVKLNRVSGIQDRLISEFKDISKIKTKMLELSRESLELKDQLYQAKMNEIRAIIEDHATYPDESSCLEAILQAVK